MAIDLHTHSSFSDGSDTPTELFDRAASMRLKAIALTDHDTLEGIAEARVAAERHGIELIPGTELSLESEKGGMHLVVLWLEPVSGPLQDRLAGLQVGRDERNARMVDRLCELGLPIGLEEVLEEAGEGSVGRPHIAAVMVRHGHVDSMEQAFAEYLGNGKAAYVGRERLGPREAIQLARASGGVPILAHPHTLGVDNRFEMADLLVDLSAHGLIGIECHYGTYTAGGRAGMVALAGRFGLLPSGGSDYHGTYKSDVELGLGRVGIPVPDAILEDLRHFAVPA
jgi:predicted metal-dependent phosphoesterase TrpH